VIYLIDLFRHKNSAETTCLSSGFHAYTSNKLFHAALHGVSLTYSWRVPPKGRVPLERGNIVENEDKNSSKSLFFYVFITCGA